MQFIKVKEEHLEQILKWRTSEQVTKNMFTDVNYSLENQKKWYEKIARDSSSRYWIISFKEKLIGLVSFNQINLVHKYSYWAYYIGDPDYNIVGGMIGPYIYNYAFNVLKWNKVLGEVMDLNTSVRKIHLLHGCREVGCYKDHIFKQGKYHDVYIYEMLSTDWANRKEQYKKYIGYFEQ